MDLKPLPQMVNAPRANPYYYWWPDEVTDKDGIPLTEKEEEA
jgi:hypothetical protein